jgi:serine/threonine protein kinase
LVEERARNRVERLSRRITELESENETLGSQNQSLQEELQLLQGQFTDYVNAKEPLDREYQLLQERLADCQEERQVLQEHFIKCQEEKQQFLAAQQESMAFNIEAWKVPHNKVKLGRLIGRGGWGAVNEGKLKVAIKQFFPDILRQQNIARLQREIRLLALVRHPNLLQFIAAAFDTEGGNHRQNPPYIITELLDTSLRVAYEQKQLENKNQLSVFQDTARALDYLHQRYEPIIHRDVSSANVLLKRQPDGSWLAKVSDLGSANLAREAYTLNEGSRVYCAPEAFTEKSKTRSDDTLTTKIDVFSFGVMLCEVVTAQFPDEDRFLTLVQSTRHLWPQIHPLIRSCIEHHPDRRPYMADVLITLRSIPARR